MKDIKCANVKCHNVTKHKVFDQIFPLKSELRSNKQSQSAIWSVHQDQNNKTKYRSRLTNERLHVCMRMALTPFQPRFKILAGQARAQYLLPSSILTSELNTYFLSPDLNLWHQQMEHSDWWHHMSVSCSCSWSLQVSAVTWIHQSIRASVRRQKELFQLVSDHCRNRFCSKLTLGKLARLF